MHNEYEKMSEEVIYRRGYSQGYYQALKDVEKYGLSVAVNFQREEIQKKWRWNKKTIYDYTPPPTIEEFA